MRARRLGSRSAKRPVVLVWIPPGSVIWNVGAGSVPQKLQSASSVPGWAPIKKRCRTSLTLRGTTGFCALCNWRHPRALNW